MVWSSVQVCVVGVKCFGMPSPQCHSACTRYVLRLDGMVGSDRVQVKQWTDPRMCNTCAPSSCASHTHTPRTHAYPHYIALAHIVVKALRRLPFQAVVVIGFFLWVSLSGLTLLQPVPARDPGVVSSPPPPSSSQLQGLRPPSSHSGIVCAPVSLSVCR